VIEDNHRNGRAVADPSDDIGIIPGAFEARERINEAVRDPLPDPSIRRGDR
jgi:hypothetical protein